MIHTDRLVLRRWRDGDRGAFAALNADPEVMAHYPAPLTTSESDALIDRIEQCWDERGWGLWALEVPDVAELIGYTGLWPADHIPGAPEAEVGWRLAVARWGHGYATEAARAALAFGFVDHAMDEIVSFTVPANTRSRHVMERIGLRRDRDGDFDHPSVDRHLTPHLVRHVMYRIDRDRWLDQSGDR